MSKNKSKKTLIIVLTAFASLIAVLGIAVLGFIGYFRLSVNGYYKASEKAFKIPGLNDGFVAQGMHYDERENVFFITGYDNDGDVSPVHLVNKDSGERVKSVKLLKADGTDFKGHAGGIAVNGAYVYVAGGASKCIWVYSYNDIINAGDGGSVVCQGKFETKISDEDAVNVSCVTVEGDRLIVGEFYREPEYPTPDSHKMTTTAGDYNQALGLEYKLDPILGLASYGIVPVATKAYSLPDAVQGIALHDGKIYVSTSWGLSFSRIYAYDESKCNQEGKLNYITPLYALDSASLVEDYKIAPMSEEISFVDGELYVMCESASKKYIFGNLIGARWCYKTDLSKMK